MIKGFHCPEENTDISFDYCLQCAASHENKCQFDYPILSAMQANIRREDGISVTSLLNCLRKVVLQTRNDVYLNPKELYWAFRGQLFHSIIAQAQSDGAVCETRFEKTIAGITLCGHPDVIYPAQRKLVDYKSTKRIPKKDEAYANHDLQVNIYRYLVAPQYEVDRLEIVYFDMSEVKRIEVPVMSVHQLTGWLVPRLKQLSDALNGGPLPEKADSEGVWQCDGYCPFTDRCWPKGVPRPWELKKREETKTNAVLKAMGRR